LALIVPAKKGKDARTNSARQRSAELRQDQFLDLSRCLGDRRQETDEPEPSRASASMTFLVSSATEDAGGTPKIFAGAFFDEEGV
jgi:hypothetical protein